MTIIEVFCINIAQRYSIPLTSQWKEDNNLHFFTIPTRFLRFCKSWSPEQTFCTTSPPHAHKKLWGLVNIPTQILWGLAYFIEINLWGLELFTIFAA